MNKANGSVSVKKTKKRVSKVKTFKSLQMLIGRLAEFPCANPKTARRRKRAIIARASAFGVTLNHKFVAIA